MRLDSSFEGGATHIDNLDPPRDLSRSSRLIRYGQPDFGRILRRQLVESQRSEETHNTARYPLGDLRKGVFCRTLCSGEHVQSAADPDKQAPRSHSWQVLARHASGGRFLRADDAGSFGESSETIDVAIHVTNRRYLITTTDGL